MLASTRIRNLPHYTISAAELAVWIESQGDLSWWSVDGDPLLTGRLDFPCPGDELAAALRRVGKALILFDPRGTASSTGESIDANRLNELAPTDDSGNRVLQLCWEEGPDVDWLLVEDSASFLL
jgi:hypothetical protein